MNFFKGRNVLITGGSGFTGSSLARNLVDKSANVTVLIRRGKNLVNLEGYLGKINVVEGDIRDVNIRNVIKGNEIIYHSAIFQGAGVKSVLGATKEPLKTFDVNVMGTVNMIQNAILEKVSKFIFISTCHVYGNQPQNLLPIKEDVIPNPVDVYSASKYAAEIALRPFKNQIEIIISRAFNQYGPGQVGDYFVPKVITSVLKGQKPVLWSSKTTRDYTYVDDVAEGHAILGEKGGANNIYHFSSGKEISMGEVLKFIGKAFDLDELDAEWKSDRPQDFSRSYGDSSKARHEFGWKPKISMEKGIKMTVEWWKKHSTLWDLELKTV